MINFQDKKSQGLDFEEAFAPKATKPAIAAAGKRTRKPAAATTPVPKPAPKPASKPASSAKVAPVSAEG